MSINLDKCRPLGLDAWHYAGYMAAMQVIDDQAQRFDTIGKATCQEMGLIALRSNLAHQASRNAREHQTMPIEDVTLREEALRGDIMPHEMVKILHQYPEIESAELARLTHVGSWNTNTLIDEPVRKSLEDSSLDTEPSRQESYYTINALNHNHPNEVGIGRKRVLYSHLGGSVLTVITNNLLVDLSDKTLPRDFRISLREYVRDKKEFRYADHHNFLREGLESQLRNPDCSKKESGLIPLSTIYYATVASARARAAEREEHHPD